MSKAWNAANNDQSVIRKQRLESKAQIACRICEKLFFPCTGGQVTCSQECSLENQRRSHAKYDKENHEKIMSRKKELYREKIESMSPEEYRDYREKQNERQRKAYAEKKRQKEDLSK
ncbi:MAG: hypothetical protein IJ955_03075 [Oscillospiraceae bacterium]|nr:hypothetical protein [Oscillospiraceae bacterium]